MADGQLKITLRRSLIGCHKRRRRTIRALGLKRIGQTTVKPDNASIRGMLAVVSDLVHVEPVQASRGDE